jgi:hypothetical protein
LRRSGEVQLCLTPSTIKAAPTLFAAFLHFDMSFMVWILLAPAVQIAPDLHLDPAAQPFPKTPRSEPDTSQAANQK